MADHAYVDELVRRVLTAGDRDTCFAEVYRLRFGAVTQSLINRGVDPEGAVDLAQDVFVRVYTGIEGSRFDSRFDTWLFRIADNVWKSYVRDQKARKRAATVLSIDEGAGEAQPALGERLVDQRDGPHEAAVAGEQSRALAAAVAELPARMRRCVRLRLQDWKYEDIARILKVSVSTVKSPCWIQATST